MSRILDGLLIDTAPGKAKEADLKAATDRLAVSAVRRQALRHDRRCRGECLHRNHRRDTLHLSEQLNALGLDDTPAEPGDYESRIEWASISRSDAAHMSGRAYSDR